MGLFDSVTKYKGQDYEALRKQHQQSGHPFIDPEFPPDNKSLFYSGGASSVTGIEWKRPKEICSNPRLMVEGTSTNDVNQGELGNCWFVAASSCLAQNKEFLHKVIPDPKDQEWDEEQPEKYAGIFHFRFWRYGEWLDVVIDDFLPTRGGKLVSVHSKTENEFWSALLEKAYAKLFGCYEVLDGGELAEGLEDFTGGLSEPVDLLEGNYKALPEEREKLFSTMKKEMEYNALMAAAIPATSKDEMEQATEMGLVKGHAYGIIAVKRVAIGEVHGLFSLFNQEKLPMIKLRNPWGGSEWKGAFSDGSSEWEKISKSEKEKIGLTIEEDGEFWMTFEDYCEYFHHMCICRMVNTTFFSLRRKWYDSELHSEWSPPSRGGGCINNKDTFLNNPQFLFSVTEDESEVLMALTQKSSRTSADDDKMTIGFTLMKVEENRKYRIHQPQEVVKSSSFKNSRSVFLRHFLSKGRYLLLACTFKPGLSGNFMLRLYTLSTNKAKEVVLDKPKRGFSSCCACIPFCKYPECITRITIRKAVGLEKQDTVGGADPYAYIKCEGETYRTPVKKDTLNPEWNTSFILYRKNPMSEPIIVEIWNNNTLMDSFMGRQQFTATDETDGLLLETDLMGKKGHEGEKHAGKLFVQFVTKRNLISL